jgi:hypothetical protein
MEITVYALELGSSTTKTQANLELDLVKQVQSQAKMLLLNRKLTSLTEPISSTIQFLSKC